jgi:hypothetical protein
MVLGPAFAAGPMSAFGKRFAERECPRLVESGHCVFGYVRAASSNGEHG